MQEEYDVNVRPKRRSNFSRIAVVIIVITALIAIPIYFLTYNPIVTANTDRPVEVDNYRLATNDKTMPESQKVLERDTDILTQTVYGADNELIGTLYNVYADAETGEIYWLSVSENNNPDKGVRLVVGSDVSNLKDGEPIKINHTRAAFLDIPLQSNVEEKLNGLLSLRHLPGSTINDPKQGGIGNVTHATYFNGKLDRVYFRTGGQEFYVPFDALQYKMNSYSYMHDYVIELTARQAGGIQMYLQNSNQF